jgi:hypothetical protein
LAVTQSQDNIHHGDAEARRNTGSGDREIGGSSDREIGGSGDLEKVALGVGQLVVGEIKSKSKTRKPQGTQRNTGSGNRVIG